MSNDAGFQLIARTLCTSPYCVLVLVIAFLNVYAYGTLLNLFCQEYFFFFCCYISIFPLFLIYYIQDTKKLHTLYHSIQKEGMCMPIKKRIFYSVCLISFTGSFLSTALNIAIPSMAADFDVLPDALTWVVTVFLITSAAFLLPFGKISDIYGRRRTYMTALIGFDIATFSAAFSPSLTILLLLRIVQGMFLAAIYVSYMPLLLTTTNETCQGRILGITVGLTYLGLSVGPVLGGILSQFAGWRCIFIIPAILTAIAYWIMRPIHDEWYAKGAPFVNIVSSALSISGIICFLWSLSSYETNRFFIWLGLGLLILFLVHESRSYHPLLPLFIFRNTTFSMSNLAAFIQYSATYAISFLLSLYLQIVLDISPALSGCILLVQPIMMAICSPQAGALSDRYGARYIASIGLGLTTLGLLLFSFFIDASLWLLVIVLFLIGIGSALFGAPNNSAIMSAVKPTYHGIASSMLALVRNLGQACSMAFVTLILSAATTSYSSYANNLRIAIQEMFLLFAILCFFAILASLARGRTQNKI